MTKWITDRKPTEEGYYLVTIEGIYGNHVCIMYRRKEYWCEFDDNCGDIAYSDDEILAWMPLPKPYEERR